MEKIIDKKGKVFGFINVIDLIVLLIIIALAAGVGYKLLSIGNKNKENNKKDIYVTVLAESVTKEVATNLNVGDKLVASGQLTSTEIVAITYKPAVYISTNEKGEAVLSEHPYLVDVTAILKDKANPSSISLIVDEQEVRVGRKFLLKTHIVEVSSEVIGINFDTMPEMKQN